MAGTRWDRYDVGIAAAAASVTLLVHPVSGILRHPYWVDEAWVAALTRAPLTRLPRLSSSSPLGFVVLARSVPGAGLQRGRLVALAFSVLTVVAAYILVRLLEWKDRAESRVAASVVALVVMTAPLSLVRNDLKQYTCDAFCALTLLTLAALAQRVPTRPSLAWLAGTSLLAAPFSSTAMFVAGAAFAALLARALRSRDRRRALDVLIAGTATGAMLFAYYVAVVAPNLNSKLHDYWAGWYLTGSPQHVASLVLHRLSALSPGFAMPAIVFVALFGVGLVVLVRHGASAPAVAVAFLWLEMALVGRLQRYPFLNQRTSHFLLVSSLVVVALGAVGVVEYARRKGGRNFARVLSAVLAVVFAIGAVGSVHRLALPDDDIRTETRAVATRVQSNDVVIVSKAADFGFAYYWPHGHLTFHHDQSAQTFRAQPAGLHAVYLTGRTDKDVLAGLRAAADLRYRTGGRIYIVRAHNSTSEVIAWRRAFAALGMKPRVAQAGSDPLLVVDSATVAIAKNVP